jgi:hypothetical protein
MQFITSNRFQNLHSQEKYCGYKMCLFKDTLACVTQPLTQTNPEQMTNYLPLPMSYKTWQDHNIMSH